MRDARKHARSIRKIKKWRRNTATEVPKSQYKKIIDKYLIKKDMVTSIAKEYNTTRAEIYGILRKNDIKCRGRFKDVTGQTFGFLKVLKMTQVKGKKRMFTKAICYCLNCKNSYFLVDVSALKRGSTTSCGCRTDWHTKVTGKNSGCYKGYEEIRGTYWNGVKRQASERGLEFNVDISVAWNIYLKQGKKCSLSGLPINFGRAGKRKENTASLDRIDPLEGYTEKNIQWVHKDVNMMKYAFTQGYFVNLCRLIAKNSKSKNINKWSEVYILQNREDNIGRLA